MVYTKVANTSLIKIVSPFDRLWIILNVWIKYI
jgi:hypothetical protein